MKFRYGFVSNSSSMSFIVAFPNEIRTTEDLRKLILDNLNESYQITDQGGEVIDKEEILIELFKQIENQTPNDGDKAIDRLNGYILVPKDAGVNWSKYNITILEKQTLTMQEATNIFDELKKDDKYIYTFIFDTSDYIYQAISRSLLFINFDHVHIVNH